LPVRDSGSVERGRSLQVHLLASRLAARSRFASDCLNTFRSSELATQFLSQEIDGQALLLLREDHLISTMNIKLGPALKICVFLLKHLTSNSILKRCFSFQVI
uniref:SAM domain-containing protein n=1 Tax=Xiphophorus couchianus TaxID=32473 RepID=A0A3B5MWS3_9TELE